MVLPTMRRKANSSVAARVNGASIYQSDIDRGVAEVARTQKFDANSLPLVQADVLRQIIDHSLRNKFLVDQKVAPSKEELDSAIDDMRNKFKQQGVNFDEYLAKNHQTETNVRAGMAEQLAWNKVVRKLATDETLQKIFDQFHEQFDGTQRRVSHILLRPDGPADQEKIKALLDEASKLRDQITAGTVTFDAAAEKYSAGPSRHNGGDLGYHSVARRDGRAVLASGVRNQARRNQPTGAHSLRRAFDQGDRREAGHENHERRSRRIAAGFLAGAAGQSGEATARQRENRIFSRRSRISSRERPNWIRMLPARRRPRKMRSKVGENRTHAHFRFSGGVLAAEFFHLDRHREQFALAKDRADRV